MLAANVFRDCGVAIKVFECQLPARFQEFCWHFQIYNSQALRSIATKKNIMAGNWHRYFSSNHTKLKHFARTTGTHYYRNSFATRSLFSPISNPISNLFIAGFFDGLKKPGFWDEKGRRVTHDPLLSQLGYSSNGSNNSYSSSRNLSSGPMLQQAAANLKITSTSAMKLPRPAPITLPGPFVSIYEIPPPNDLF